MIVEKTVDPRIRRTRLLLQQALDKLLEKRAFDDISIQDIADAATVNRATFYDHYPDKFALLTCTIGCRFQELVTHRKVEFKGTCAGELKTIVLVVCDYLANSRRQLESHMESAIITAVREILLAGFKQHVPHSAVAPEIIAASVSWAIYGAAKEWAQTPDRCSSEEIAVTVTALVAPMLHLPA
ncbi:MAG: TetR/AcrR family transcriptional regulator [Bryobacteraceae bacterium]|jgi:AcrR family transcriptional regulator